jgi:eukaryotic-like serine/threonine-protein kinase
MAGEILGSRYELMEPIGRGGMATIYRARDQRMNRLVAVKVLREVYSTDRKFITRFQMEARAASSLTHPNIVQVYDYGQSADNYYIVMEFIQGVDLRRYLKTHHILDVDQAIAIAHDVALGLGAAHRKNIVHRDVKPQNIMVNGEGLVKLTDFGIASMYKDLSAERLTTTGMTLGTVQYYAPEQAQGEIVKPAADVYALGIVMYEMLTGKPPFDGDTPVSVAVRHIQDLPEPPRKQNPKIPLGLEALILRCLEKDPRDRYANGDELAKALDNYEDEADTARATGPYEYGPKNVVQAGQGSGVRPPLSNAPSFPAGARGSGGLLSGMNRPSSGLGSPGGFNNSGGFGPRAGPGAGMSGRSVSRPLPPSDLEEDEDWEEPNYWNKPVNPAASTRPFGAAPGTMPRSPVASGPMQHRARRATAVTMSLIGAATLVLLGLSCYLASQLGLGAGLLTSVTGNNQPTPTPSTITVPGVVGLQADNAETILVQAGFKVTRAYTYSTQPQGTVVTQQPGPESTAARGSIVTITISQGQQTNMMPDVRGEKITDAQKLLDNPPYQLQVNVVHKPSVKPNDTVIDQDPLPGTVVQASQPVTLTVSIQVTPTPTPTPTPSPTVPVPTPTPTALLPSDGPVMARSAGNAGAV